MIPGIPGLRQLRRVRLQPDEAPELLSVLRFLRATTGSEALGIAFAAAYIEAAPAEVLTSDAGVEALDALGTLAERLARRRASAHMDIAARYASAIQLKIDIGKAA